MSIDPKANQNTRELELIAGCQKNDRKAQFEFFKLYSVKFLGVVYRFAPDEDMANDLLQEGFIKIFTHIKDYKHQGSFEGWMRRIIINTSIDYIKKHHKMNFESIDNDHIPNLGVDAFPIEKMNTDEIVNAITQLAPGYRTILNLYAIEGYSYTEIAETLQVKESTVRSQYLRAKQKLAVLLRNNHIHTAL
jgi:RNA polymerase sigma-70 factor (ECF subfamily)